MNKSESISELAKALVKVQSALQPAAKESTNPFFKAKYADLGSIWDSCRKLLTDNGLAVSQLSQITLEGAIVETVLMHSSGEWISGEIYLPLTKHDPQAVGSAITYGRRYGLAAICGIVAESDDDGNAASQPPPTRNQQQNKPPPSKPASGRDELIARIRKAEGFIKELGGKVEESNLNAMSFESLQDEFTAVTDQYKRLEKSRK